MKIYAKLNDARQEFHTIKLKKSGSNKFAGYQYFELGDFLIPALTTFSKHGLCAYISFGKEMATMTVICVEDGSKIELTSPMAEAQLKGCHPIQNLGAVETYTRRYLWVAALEIVEHDALDSSPRLPEAGDIRGTAKQIPARPKIELSEDDERFLQEIAMDVIGLCNDGKAKEARELIFKNTLDSEQSIALSNMLDSKVRAALKKAKEGI